MKIYDVNNIPDEFFKTIEFEELKSVKEIIEDVKKNKDEGIKREMQYNDITILIDRKVSFEVYQKVFEYLKIPLTLYHYRNMCHYNHQQH